jgi:hypothetical protein
MTNTTTPNLLYSANSGSSSSNPFIDVFESRNPTTNDVNYPIQKKWTNTSTGEFWELIRFTSFNGHLQAIWLQIGTSVVSIESLIGNDSVAVGPDPSNDIFLVGDGTFIKTVGNSGTFTMTIEPASGLATQYTGNTGTAAASANNLNLLGSQGISSTASGSTVTMVGQPAKAASSSSLANLGVASFNNADFTVDGNGFVSFSADTPYYSLTPFIVGPDVHSQFTTIQSAITAATAPATIRVKAKNGNYVENLVMKPGVIVTGDTGVVIQGKMTFPTAGSYEVDGCTLITNGDFAVSVSGSNAIIAAFYECTINATDHIALDQSNSNAGTLLYIENCNANIINTGLALYSHTGVGVLNFFNCNISNSALSTTPSVNSSGTVSLFYNFIAIATNTSSTGSLAAEFCNWDTSAENITPLTSAGSGLITLVQCTISSGTASCASSGVGTTISLYNSSFFTTNTHAITGAGVVGYSGLSIPSGDINTTTVNKLNFYAGTVVP